MRKLILVVLSVLLFSCGSGDRDEHGADTCSAGDNMTNPRLGSGFDLGAPAPEFRVLWDAGTGRGAELPDHYFDSVRLAQDLGAQIKALVQSVEHSAPREIAVRFDGEALAAFLETQNTVKLTLEFRDRATVLDCSHPGMADVYLLDVTLVFQGDTLSSSQVAERKRLGAI
jgi:hypothetical protein